MLTYRVPPFCGCGALSDAPARSHAPVASRLASATAAAATVRSRVRPTKRRGRAAGGTASDVMLSRMLVLAGPDHDRAHRVRASLTVWHQVSGVAVGGRHHTLGPGRGPR